MSAVDETRLRELAEAATPGPWTKDDFKDGSCVVNPRFGLNGGCNIVGANNFDFGSDGQANAAFIAASNPATILALLDALSAERERGDRAVAALEKIADVWSLDCGDMPSGRRWHCQHEQWLQAASSEAQKALATQKAEGA